MKKGFKNSQFCLLLFFSFGASHPKIKHFCCLTFTGMGWDGCWVVFINIHINMFRSTFLSWCSVTTIFGLFTFSCLFCFSGKNFSANYIKPNSKIIVRQQGHGKNIFSPNLLIHNIYGWRVGWTNCTKSWFEILLLRESRRRILFENPF